MAIQSNGPADKPDLIGQDVLGHEIIKKLGAGGMGSVYLARHRTLGMLRAIKVIHDDQRAAEEAKARFLREAMALATLHHPNVVRVIDFGELGNGWPFLCMEYVDGKDLDAEVGERGPLSVGEAITVLQELASALAYTHSVGLVHRDLKPANLILRGGEVDKLTVIDFGLVKLLSNEARTRLTADRQVLGSPLYMSPEQADGSAGVGPAADVYAMGGIGHFLLTGQAAFPPQPLLALIYAHCMETPERLSKRAPNVPVPESLDTLLFECLAKKQDDRPTAAQLVERLEAIAGEVDGQPKIQLRLSMVASAAAAAAAAVALAPMSEAAPVASIDPNAGMAAMIWGDQPPPNESGVRDALFNQICAVILELATVCGDDSVDGDEIRGMATLIENVDRDVSNVELDAALVDSQLSELSPHAPEVNSLRGSRDDLNGRVAMLRAKQRKYFRYLFELVLRVRSRQRSAEAAHLSSELDGLTLQFRQASGF